MSFEYAFATHLEYGEVYVCRLVKKTSECVSALGPLPPHLQIKILDMPTLFRTDKDFEDWDFESQQAEEQGRCIQRCADEFGWDRL